MAIVLSTKNVGTGLVSAAGDDNRDFINVWHNVRANKEAILILQLIHYPPVTGTVDFARNLAI